MVILAPFFNYTHVGQHFIPRLVRVTPHNIDEPLLKEGGMVGGTGGSNSNKLKLQITQHKAGGSSSNAKSKKKKETKDKREYVIIYISPTIKFFFCLLHHTNYIFGI